MKKRILSCIILMIFLGLICLAGYRKSGPRAVMGKAVTEEGNKKIALTFDDDVIIGLSQEISYKEAVSMI